MADKKDKKRGRSTARIARRAVQAIAFAVFIFLILASPGITEGGSRAGWIPRLSPLGAVSVLLGAREIVSAYWPALAVVALTLIFGRFFCGWVCPMGATIDVADLLLKSRRNKPEEGPYDGRRLKYYILVALLVSAALGAHMTGWLDPLSLVVRSYVIVVHAYLVRLIVGLLGWMSGLPGLDGPASAATAWLVKRQIVPPRSLFETHALFLAIFLIILGLGAVRSRYWCRNLCPLGAMLALMSDWGIAKRKVGEACISCRKCERECPMQCIGEKGHATSEGECVLCMDCQEVCPVDAIRFRREHPVEQAATVNLQRRAVFESAAAGVAAVPLLKLNPVRVRELELASAIRPPAIADEDAFLSRCVRCGECMRVCRTGGLQPTLLESGLAGLWTPRLVPRIGYCDYLCTRCGNACPSGAIPQVSQESKWNISIGKARIDPGRCIPWVGYSNLPNLEKEWKDCNCAVCEEVCPVPTKAIHFSTVRLQNGNEIRRPVVDGELCVGCGFCEHKCPLTGLAGIRVNGDRQRMAEAREDKPQSDEQGGEPDKTEQPKEEAKKAGTEDLAAAFPAQIGKFKLGKAPETYLGPQGLWDYMDGGGEPYLTLRFTAICVAKYLPTDAAAEEAEDNGASVELWRFETPDDSYGAFTKDRAGLPTEGDEGTWVEEGALWAWKGQYYLSVNPTLNPLTDEDVIEIAKAVIANLKAEPSEVPEIVKGLPAEGLRKDRIHFFRRTMLVNSVVLAPQQLDDQILGLDKDSEAVCAAYSDPFDEGIVTIVIDVQYADATAAEAAAKRIEEAYAKWGLEKQEDGVMWKAKDGYLFARKTRGGVLRMAHFAKEEAGIAGLFEQ
ncbi:MAG TPA: 4Fe-4S binding protein [Candidatus Brocadiia bacterium]|nr:4Fe-4S binding protein [Candidatus Brocadiia bacterium]